MAIKRKYHPVIEDLVNLISKNGWAADFETAIKNVHSKKVPLINHVATTEQYLDWMNEFLYWIPTEDSSGQSVNDQLSAFYFIADQKPILALQNKVLPFDKALPLTPFS